MSDFIIRKAKNKENPYSIISNSALRDTTLSWKATGLLAYLLSLPDDWRVNIRDLTNRKTDGKDSTITAIKELVNYGYVQRVQTRSDTGKFNTIEYWVFENPGNLTEQTKPNHFEHHKWERGERGNYDDISALTGYKPHGNQAKTDTA